MNAALGLDSSSRVEGHHLLDTGFPCLAQKVLPQAVASQSAKPAYQKMNVPEGRLY